MASDQTWISEGDDRLRLAEDLRRAVGTFVRSIRTQSDTPTNSQSETLSILDRGGPLSVAELAARRNVRHQSMRLVAASLEENGLVEKLPNPADGRSQLISITAEGQAELSRSREARTRKIAALIEERLSDQERQALRAAIRILDRLA
ncbi:MULTISPECIES: MarR family transcriptional regulator [Alphaproteobacteria]|uniref:MarR family transcriptional regulator n=1 Tax=Edaphosphingomonas fennica TaxID=114404 RepID=A0A2T4I8D1_9SPHN|nr:MULTISPECIES: MarR family transcriptional regulator [Alphaproteobacteria]PTD27924.1 MarR family transcriptional regulator [Sphingomonas fennica]QYA11958.1 MarR family transcriptional regulator [Rhizobium sp. AB2/73]UEQ82111.1 MarR family transcriptional regulator [Rhizobium sp. AB2/73]